MNGFFTRQQTESATRPSGKVHSCASCGLYKNALSPKMKPYGNFKRGILNIGEAPGAVEDERGKPWQGKTGLLLKKTYRRLGIDLFEDCLNMNAVNCRPFDEQGYNRTPTNEEIACCRKMILETIDKYQPKLIAIFGGSAIQSLLGHRWKKDLGGITKWRGWTIPDQDYGCWLCPTFHPSYVERSDKEVETVWLQDMQRIVETVDKPFLKHKKPEIQYPSQILDWTSDMVAIDYETTGLKPDAAGQRIVCASVAVNEDLCRAFMMPATRKERQPLIDLLKNLNVGKIAHNIKFEEAWSIKKLRQPVLHWEWDSMLAAHVLDNRPGVTSLKFQTYVNFGIMDYDSEVAPYIKGKTESGNDMNRINELLVKSGGDKKLLKYCALDSIYTYRLAMKQMKEIDYDFLPF